MKKPVLLALMLAVVAAIAGCGSGGTAVPVASDQPQPDKTLFDLGTRLMADGNVVEAIPLLQTLIDSYPDSAFAGHSKLILDDCVVSQECNFYLAQIKALPPGGGQIFYPNMPDGLPD